MHYILLHDFLVKKCKFQSKRTKAQTKKEALRLLTTHSIFGATPQNHTSTPPALLYEAGKPICEHGIAGRWISNEISEKMVPGIIGES